MGQTLEQVIQVKINALVAGLSEVKKLQKELTGLEKQAGKKLSVNTTNADKALNLFRQLSGQGDAVISKFEGIEKAGGTSFGGLAASAGIGAAALFAVGGAIAFVSSKITELVQEAVEVGSRFHDMSIETGVAVETFSGLENQLRQSRATTEDLNNG
ncbi:MAG: hypothetical protein M3362_15555, partial [Acidobacteriota bacterium]|nr:hypothetical protein [Acidobacteriota bacterium]